MMKAMPVGSADRSRGALVRIGQCGLAAALLCLSAPGHAEPGPELIEAAEGEGELTAYIALANEVAQAWFEDFSEKYGIEVQTYRASTATVSRRILTEKEAGATSADVAILTEIPTWENLISEGIVEDYTPTTAGEFDPALTIPGKMYPLYLFSYALAWNTNRVTPEEESLLMKGGFEELLDPKWKDRLGITIPQAGANFGEYYRITEDRGWEYWEKLKDNAPKLYESVSPMQARLVQGEIDVAVSANSGSVAGYVAKGAPIHFTYPDGAASTSPFGIGVMAGATHPNAARLFVEWATSADAQSKLSKIVNTSPANKNAENLAEIESLPWFKPATSFYMDGAGPKAMAEREDFIERWSKTMGYVQ